MTLNKGTLYASIIGSLVALGTVGIVLYFTWPTIVKKMVASAKEEATAQNLLTSFFDSFKTL